MNGSSYVLTLIDGLSRFTWVYFLKKNYEVLEKFIDFKAYVENVSGRKLKALRSNNG